MLGSALRLKKTQLGQSTAFCVVLLSLGSSNAPSASCGSFGSGEHRRLCKLIRVDLMVRTGLQASVE